MASIQFMNWNLNWIDSAPQEVQFELEWQEVELNSWEFKKFHIVTQQNVCVESHMSPWQLKMLSDLIKNKYIYKSNQNMFLIKSNY